MRFHYRDEETSVLKKSLNKKISHIHEVTTTDVRKRRMS